MRSPPAFRHADLDPTVDQLVRDVLAACVEVRRELGVGLVESVYVQCLAAELAARGIPFELEVRLPITYKGKTLDRSFRADVVVAETLLLEAKALDALHDAHFAQLLTYLRLSALPVGLLVNFNSVPFRDGIHRRVNTLAQNDS